MWILTSSVSSVSGSSTGNIKVPGSYTQGSEIYLRMDSLWPLLTTKIITVSLHFCHHKLTLLNPEITSHTIL